MRKSCFSDKFPKVVVSRQLAGLSWLDDNPVGPELLGFDVLTLVARSGVLSIEGLCDFLCEDMKRVSSAPSRHRRRRRRRQARILFTEVASDQVSAAVVSHQGFASNLCNVAPLWLRGKSSNRDDHHAVISFVCVPGRSDYS